MTVRPFPWATLDAVARADVALLRDLGRWLRAAGAVERAGEALRASIGSDAAVRLRALEAVAGPPADEAVAVAIAFEGGGANGSVAPAVVELEPALAIEVVSRVAGRRLTTGPAADPRAAHAASQALSAIFVKALRRARGDADPRVVAAGAAHVVLASAAIADPCAAVIMVLVDDDAYRARVIVSRRAVAAAAEPAPSRATLTRLGSLPLAIPVVLATAWATAREVAALQPGDAFMPSGLSAARNVPCVLAGARIESGLAGTLEGTDRVVVGNSVEDLAMTDAAERTLLDSALDAPVVVRIEIGTVQLAAREWAGLKPGDVVTLDRRIGAPVTLRAGGAELGTGELVDVEGEIGVRILSLAEPGS